MYKMHDCTGGGWGFGGYKDIEGMIGFCQCCAVRIEA